MNVKTTFLNGILEEEIYLEFPEGIEKPRDSNLVLKFHKSFYGLCQSSKAWYQQLDDHLLNTKSILLLYT